MFLQGAETFWRKPLLCSSCVILCVKNEIVNTDLRKERDWMNFETNPLKVVTLGLPDPIFEKPKYSSCRMDWRAQPDSNGRPADS